MTGRSQRHLREIYGVDSAGDKGKGNTPIIQKPVNTSLPIITGTPTQGQTLTVSQGTWTNTPTGYAYQWKANGANIVGATANTYALTVSEVGKTITATVTASNAVGSTPATSAGVGPVALPDPGPFPTFAPAFYRGSADNPANTTAIINQSFAPADVQVGGSKITTPDLGFAVFAGYNSMCANSIWFEADPGSTLPGGIVPGKRYYPSPVSGGTEFYPEASDADWASIPRSTNDEAVLRAQNFAQGVNKLVFSSAGTGTFRIKSDELCQVAPDLGGGAFTIEARIPANKHSWMPIKVDEDGRKYFDSRVLARNHNEQSATNAIYGNSPIQGPNAQKFNARKATEAKRSVVATFVTRFEPTNTFTISKAAFVPANVNTSTGVITHNKAGTSSAVASGQTTLSRTRVIPDPGSTLPAGLAANTDYWCRISGTGTTLHPTLTDATNNTNVIIPTTQGVGGFILVCPENPGSLERQRFLTEMLDPAGGGNVCTAQWPAGGASDNVLIMPTDFLANGQVGAIGRTIIPVRTAPVRMYFQFPKASTPPTRVDTGLPMTSGWYWVIRYQASSAYSCIYDDNNYAGAVSGIGVAIASNGSIKFSSSGQGRVAVKALGQREFLTGTVRGTVFPNSATLIPENTNMVLSSIIDYDDPSASFIRYKVLKDATLWSNLEGNGAKGVTGTAVNDGSPAWTPMNSAASHVTYEGRVYALMFSASVGAITETDMAPVHSWYQNKYGIA